MCSFVELLQPSRSSTQALPDRTFVESNYKRFYDASGAALFQHELLAAVHNMLTLFVTRLNPTLDEHTVVGDVNKFMGKIQDDAFQNNKALKDDVSAVAEYLWTSDKSHDVVKGMELCSVLNAVIREDVAEEIAAATKIFRTINTRRVHRVRTTTGRVDSSYPRNGETWRGGGFRQECGAFFERIKGHKYRVPGFLASSQKKQIAAAFAHGAGKN
jgi:hypothetical protein